MHNTTVELQGKCRRLFYAKVDLPVLTDADGVQGDPILAGAVLGIASGGGALEELTGDNLISATFNDPTAPARIGCIEEFYSTSPESVPLRVDLAKVQTCIDAVTAHRTAVQAERDYVFETGIVLFGSEHPTTERLEHSLKVQELHTRGKADREADHTEIVDAQARLAVICQDCLDCCEQLLVTRDEVITFDS